MDKITIQYIQAVITILLGIIGILLPQKYNPFQFKRYGLGRIISDLLSDNVKKKIPKVIGILLIFTGVVVGGLTPFLGEMPW
ncbi:MAG: hypothetical protein WCX95_01430 [Candidatus Gracilibacteria bacterium]